MAEFNDFNLTLVRGDDYLIPFFVTNTNSEGQTIRQPLDGYQEIWFYAKRKPTDPDADAVFVKRLTDDGVMVTSSAEGEGEVVIVPADTLDLTNDRVYNLYAGLKIEDPDGRKVTLAQGRVKIGPVIPEADG